MDAENEGNWIQWLLKSETTEQDLSSGGLGTTSPDVAAIQWPTGYGIKEGIPGMGSNSLADTWLSGVSKNTAQESTSGTDSTSGTTTGSSALDPLRAFLSNPSMQAFNSLMRSGVGMGGTVGLMALLGALNRARPSGGGYTGTASPTPTNRTMVQGKYGPIAQYAAQGGLMHAYAHGGAVTGTHRNPLRMEDGGFVMTKRAVDGAGGPRGIAQMLPGARPIVGPGTGTSDHIPATIDGRTPARVSNGEAYVPKRAVNQAGGAEALYALMNQLQRRA